MVRRVLALALAVQLMLPAYAVESWLSAVVAASAAEPLPNSAKVCPCTGKAACKCCGCDEEPDAETPPAADPGPHVSFQCRCKVAESLAVPIVYLSLRGPTFQSLCQPREERLLVRVARWLSPALPIDSPPPKI